MLAVAIGERMEQVGLRLHPDKTRIVYCKRPYFLTGDQEGGLLRVWEASRPDTGGAIDVEPVLFDAHREGIGCLTASALNGRPVVLSADGDGHVVLWDVHEQTILREFEESGIAVKGAALATVDGRVLAVVAASWPWWPATTKSCWGTPAPGRGKNRLMRESNSATRRTKTRTPSHAWTSASRTAVRSQ